MPTRGKGQRPVVSDRELYSQLIHKMMDDETASHKQKAAQTLRRRRNTLTALIIAVAFSIMTMGSIAVHAHRDALKDEAPVSYTFQRAVTDGNGLLRFFFDVAINEPGHGKLIFNTFKAVVTVMPPGKNIPGNVIPVYLGIGKIELMVQVEGMALAPGDADIQVNLIGSGGTVCAVNVHRLEPAE